MLLNHVQKASYEILDSGYFFTSLLIPRIMEVFKEKLVGRKQNTTGLVEWGGGKELTQIIKSVLLTDFYFTYLLSRIGVNFPGLSTYCLCRIKFV